MLTTSDEKTLEELGFKLNEDNVHMKTYDIGSCMLIKNHSMLSCNCKNIEQAQHDLAILREKGIV